MRFKRILFVVYLFVSAAAFAGNGFAIKTIVIDAGHGGKDPGAIGPGKTNEKDVALSVALKLGDLVQKNFPDVKIIYTRKTDVFIELHERADIANQAKADLFMAIHCNSSTSSGTYGTSTYVLGLHRTEANLEVAKRENAVILMEDDRDKNYDFDPNTPQGHIMMSMKQNAFLDQSIDMASKIESQFETSAKRKSLGVKQAGFYVIYKTTMPSLLSEIGFISNPDEEKFLNSAKGQDLIANSLFKAFKEYKFQIENSEGEQFAYEQAKKKAQEDAANDSSMHKPGYKKEQVEMGIDGAAAPKEGAVKKDETVLKKDEVVTKKDETVSKKDGSTTTKTTTTTTTKTTEASTSTQPVATMQPVATSTTTDPATVTLSGRRIKKPIENSSGGGTSVKTTESSTPTQPVKEVKEEPKVEETKPVKETAKTKTEKPVETASSTDNSTTVIEDNNPGEPVKTEVVPVTKTEEKTTAKTTSKTETKTEPKAASKQAEEKAVVVEEPKTVKPVKSETKPVVEKKTETKPVAEEKPVKTVKPKITEPQTATATSSEGTVFKVQIIALKGSFKDYAKASRQFPNISKEDAPNGLVRYYSCTVKSFSEAKRKVEEAVNNGYRDAFIVGFKNGSRMGPEEMKAFQR
ncbi:MAG: cell wall hydrolase/autolysin [Bacteroidota bacterium]|nr:cell wall hydrolase/autolysin [Bacteroidota bacterium]